MYRVQPVYPEKLTLLRRGYNKAIRKLYGEPKRAAIRKRFANSRPAPDFGQTAVLTVHSLVCHRDMWMSICSLKSLLLAVGEPMQFCLHDDGTLSGADQDLLKHHFPSARLITRREADARSEKILAQYPNCRAWRNDHVMSLKLLDVANAGSAGRMAYVDSDILFFEKPSFWVEELKKQKGQSFFNRDMGCFYAFSPEKIREELNVQVLNEINAGLWIMDRNCLSLEKIENWLGRQFVRAVYDKKKHYLEQTMVAMLAAEYAEPAGYFPESYDVAFTKPVDRSVCKHYVGRIRHGFELEGIRYLLEYKNFESRWEVFVNDWK